MKTKKLFLTLAIIAFFASCGTRRSVVQDPATFDPGVTINGITWATRNVDAPGTFAPTPESAGMLFQWNRKKGWNAVDEEVEGWDSSFPEGTKWYAENDPCPQGWRVPTEDELHSLLNAGSEWTTRNGVYGRLFGSALFLPAPGWRNGFDGALFSVGWIGNYWRSSSAPHDISAHRLGFTSSSTSMHTTIRSPGMLVRCVAE